MNSKARKPRRALRRSKGKPVRIFRMTISAYDYDEQTKQLIEHEMYFIAAKRARTVNDVKRIRAILAEKGRRHYRAWLLRHLNVSVKTIHVNFEPEYRAKRQVEQKFASVDRFALRRVDQRWQAEELPPGKMRLISKRRVHRGRQ